MLKAQDKIFSNIHGSKSSSYKESLARGDWNGIKSILKRQQEDIINEIKDSKLTGRGGANFPTGLKWSFMPPKSNKKHYLIINADESEPGTCKDRLLLLNEPHKILEGAVIASYVLNVEKIYVYLRGEYFDPFISMEKAIQEAYDQNFFGKKSLLPWQLDIYIHRGAGAYIAGEETALIESLEGKKAFPRLKPPFPAMVGLYGCPTIVNNVETIAAIPTILKRGATWFSKIGQESESGTKLFSISGHVCKPVVFEEALGLPMKELIQYYGKDVLGGWESLQGVIPGGSSTPILPKQICEIVSMDDQSLKKYHSFLGTGGMIVINKTINILDVIENISCFYMTESCGQCTPCREGSAWVWKILKDMNKRRIMPEELDKLWKITKQIEGHTICAFGDALSWPIQGVLRYFRDDILKNGLKYEN